MITIRMDDRELQDYLRKMGSKTADMTPAMRGIGEILTASTKERFTTGKAPDGTPWIPNRASTLNAYLQDRGRKRDKITGRKGAWKKGYARKGRSQDGQGVAGRSGCRCAG